nr:MAG TPA: hypothetical protein [Herelleviridae sp.]
MNKQQKRIGALSEEDMKVWAEWLVTGNVKDEKHKKQLERLSNRSVTLADVSTVVDFMGRRNDGYISSLVEQTAITEKLFNRLGITPEIRQEVKEEYEKELEELQKQIKENYKELLRKVEKEEKEAK